MHREKRPLRSEIRKGRFFEEIYGIRKRIKRKDISRRTQKDTERSFRKTEIENLLCGSRPQENRKVEKSCFRMPFEKLRFSLFVTHPVRGSVPQRSFEFRRGYRQTSHGSLRQQHRACREDTMPCAFWIPECRSVRLFVQ